MPKINLLIAPTPPREVNIITVFQDRVELSWLPPTEPNGEVHYVIYYTPEGGTEQSIDTGSNLTHYNLTGLDRNRVYTNIAVQAVTSVGRSARSAVLAPPGELYARNTKHLLASAVDRGDSMKHRWQYSASVLSYLLTMKARQCKQ